MESKTTIEVDGKDYSAATGITVGVSTAPPLRSSGHNIDGFFRPRTVTMSASKAPKPVNNSIASLTNVAPSAPELKGSTHPKPNRGVNHARPHTPQAAQARTIRISQNTVVGHAVSVRRGPANHVQHHTVQHSRTLRRDAVPAPQLSTHNSLNPKGTLQHATPSLITLKKPAAGIDTDRLARAQTASKSPMVARHASEPRSILPTFSPLGVQPVPTPSAAPAPGNGGAPGAPAPQQTNDPNIFEHALAKADHFVDIRTHRAQYRRRAHIHMASMAAGSLALIVIASFVAYQNNPGVQFKLATLKAGVSANMPNFAAAGFAYNGVRAESGKLMLGFKGNNASYQLTQADTNLSDTDMIQTIGATNSNGTPTYSVLQAGNVEVYRFSNTSATWVSDGKWYTVNGNSALSDSQVKSLVQHV